MISRRGGKSSRYGTEAHSGTGRMAGSRRVAAPLLGGVRGWVYFRETNHQGISALRRYSLQRCLTCCDYALIRIPYCTGLFSGDPSIIRRMQLNPPPNPSEEGSRDATTSRHAPRTAMRLCPVPRRDPFPRHLLFIFPYKISIQGRGLEGYGCTDGDME